MPVSGFRVEYPGMVGRDRRPGTEAAVGECEPVLPAEVRQPVVAVMAGPCVQPETLVTLRPATWVTVFMLCSTFTGPRASKDGIFAAVASPEGPSVPSNRYV